MLTLERKRITAIAVAVLMVATVFGGMTTSVSAAQKTQKIKTSKTNYVLTKGSNVKINASAKTKMTFKSANQSIASVSQKGKIVANKKGVTKIIITAKKTKKYKKATKTIKVTVVNKADYTSYTDAQKSTAKTMYKYFTSRGYTSYAACAIIGNAYVESKLNPKFEDSFGGRGLCYWLSGRFENLKKFAKENGKNWTDINVQLAFIEKEMAKLGMINSFKKSTDVEAATVTFMKEYERPGVDTSKRRIDAAVSALKFLQ